MALDPEKLRAYTDRQIRRFEKSKKDFLTKHYPAIEADFLRVVPVDKFPEHTFECFGTFHRGSGTFSMTDDAETREVMESCCNFAMIDWTAMWKKSNIPDCKFIFLIRFKPYVDWIEFEFKSKEARIYHNYMFVCNLNLTTISDQILDIAPGSKMISDILLYPEKWGI